MSKLLAVTAREVRERWLFLPAGLASGFMPLVLQPALDLRSEDARFLAAFGVGVLMIAAAVVAGSTMLARDAADGRLGFLFSRPLSWPTVWGAKWLGAISLAVGTGIAAAVSLLLTGVISWRASFEPPERIVAIGLAILGGTGVANFCATAFRSRSRWAAVDLVLVPVAVWLARRWAIPVFSLGLGGSLWLPAPWTVPTAPWFPGWRLFLFVAPLLVALVVASAVQVAAGRTDIVRAHRAMSLAFWSIILLALALAGLRLAWARASGPADINVLGIGTDPTGRWVYLVGPSRRGGTPELLVDAATGRYLALGPGRPPGMTFSADGRFAARLLTDEEDRTSAVELFDLAEPSPRARRIRLESSPPPIWRTTFAFSPSGGTVLLVQRSTVFALSPSGGTVLLVHESGASLFESASGRRVVTTTLSPGWRPAATRFLAESAVRIWLVRPAAPHAEMRVLDLAPDGSTRTASFEVGRPLDSLREWRLVVPDSQGRRLLTEDAGLHLRDGATGTLLATLVQSPGPVSAAFLADGRIVVGERIGARTRVRVFGSEGNTLSETTLDVPAAGSLQVGPELAQARVVVAVERSPAVGETVVLDVNGLAAAERLRCLVPAGRPWGQGSSPSIDAARAHFFLDCQSRLVQIDFSTGERKVVAGPGAPVGERIAGP